MPKKYDPFALQPEMMPSNRRGDSRFFPPYETQQPLQVRLQLSVTDIMTKAGKNGSPRLCRFSKRRMLLILRIPKLRINFQTMRGEHSKGIRPAAFITDMYCRTVMVLF
jgi:hypothetical protein